MILYDEEGNEVETDYLDCTCCDTFTSISKIVNNIYCYDSANEEKITRVLEAISYSSDLEQLEYKLKNL